MICLSNFYFSYVIVFGSLLVSSFVSALYEDQVGKYDWRQQYIGQTKRLLVESNEFGSGVPRRLFVAGSQGVLGAIGLRNGQLVWRQILEDGHMVDELLQCGGTQLFSLSGGGKFLRGWSSSLGHMDWESTPLDSSSKPSSGALACHPIKGSLLAVAGEDVSAYSARDGTELWRKPLSGAGFKVSADRLVLASASGTGDWLVSGVSGGQATLTVLSGAGAVRHSASVSMPWLLGPSGGAEQLSSHHDDCLLLSSGLLCLDRVSAALQLLSTTAHSEPVFQTLFLGQLGVTAPVNKVRQLSPTRFALHTLSGDCHVMSLDNVTSSQPRSMFTLPRTHVISATEYKGKSYLVTTYTSEKMFESLEVSIVDGETGKPVNSLKNSFALAKHHGSPVEVIAVLFTKKDGSLSYRLLMVTEDYAVQMLQPKGAPLWLREEALGTVLAAEMLDLPVSENQAKMEEEFGHSQGGDVVSMFAKRITTQVSQLKTFILTQLTRQQQRLSGGEADLVSSERGGSTEQLTRDDFSLQKLVVMSTASGKLFGLDSATGRPVWKLLLPNAAPVTSGADSTVAGIPLYLQRTTAHFPHPPQAAALARDKNTNKAFLFVFNPFTGVPAAETFQPPHFEKPLLQAVMMHLPAEERGDYLRPVLLLDSEMRVHVYPTDFPLSLDQRPLFLYTARREQPKLRGYKVAPSPLGIPYRYVAQPVWSVRLGVDQRLVALAGRRGAEQVHSVGRVLGNRSVLYKYLNPNLVAGVTETRSGTGGGGSSANQQNHAITIFLIDVVSGQIIFTSQTKRASGPVNLVHSENWLVYSYWNMRARRDEVAVLELFDQSAAHLKEFSSLEKSAQGSTRGPLVMRQAYILPTPAQCLSVSLTEKGITAKSILVMLKTGGLMEMPKAFLDPRRPLEPTADTIEEGVVPYMPELPMSTQGIVNYNQSLPRVRGIHTAAAGLESTSLVFVYGLDLYFTRVMPSKMFDVLKEDFDYFFISVVTIGMVVGSVVTQKLAARKALYRAWQ